MFKIRGSSKCMRVEEANRELKSALEGENQGNLILCLMVSVLSDPASVKPACGKEEAK
jgi:hypothetical protein